MEDILKQFWEAPDDAHFNRDDTAKVRCCSKAKLEREAWLGTGVPFTKDGGTALYRKGDIVKYLISGRCRHVE